MIIAIDGPSASGKGSLRRMLEERLCMPSLDTGVLYRALAKHLCDAGLGVDDAAVAAHFAKTLDPFAYSDDDLRCKDMGELASRVSAHRDVRIALLDYQREFAAGSAGAILDGRDIGTAVCPEAHFKFFVTASAQVRAGRRHREFIRRGEDVAFEVVLADIEKRDLRDSTRADAPMSVAVDALVIDTSAITPSETLEIALEHLGRRPINAFDAHRSARPSAP